MKKGQRAPCGLRLRPAQTSRATGSSRPAQSPQGRFRRGHRWLAPMSIWCRLLPSGTRASECLQGPRSLQPEWRDRWHLANVGEGRGARRQPPQVRLARVEFPQRRQARSQWRVQSSGKWRLGPPQRAARREGVRSLVEHVAGFIRPESIRLWCTGIPSALRNLQTAVPVTKC